jgi:hypothetical protein
MLWPPNHQLVSVGFGVVVDPPGTALRLQVFGDDGADASDADLTTGALLLRAERSGGGRGRVYLIVATATDASGGVGLDVCTAVVPHEQSAASIAQVQAEAAAAAAFYREHQAAPPGYAQLTEQGTRDSGGPSRGTRGGAPAAGQETDAVARSLALTVEPPPASAVSLAGAARRAVAGPPPQGAPPSAQPAAGQPDCLAPVFRGTWAEPTSTAVLDDAFTDLGGSPISDWLAAPLLV